MASEYKLKYTATEIDEKLGAVDKKAEALEITLADYNNLSEEEKNNGTVYLIPDAAEVGTDIIIDETPTEGSTNLVASGGVYDKLIEINNNLANGNVKFSIVNGELYYSVYIEDESEV